MVKEIKTNDVYAMKTLKKSKMLSQENVRALQQLFYFSTFLPVFTQL